MNTRVLLASLKTISADVEALRKSDNIGEVHSISARAAVLLRSIINIQEEELRCKSSQYWLGKIIDKYGSGLTENEALSLDAHVHSCSWCAMRMQEYAETAELLEPLKAERRKVAGR